MRTTSPILTLLIVVLAAAAACNGRAIGPRTDASANSSPSSNGTTLSPAGNAPPADNDSASASSAEQANQPKTVRDHFMALPVKYFPLEGCEPARDKGCQRAKADYLKTFLEIEDTANGYLKAGCDGGQSCLEMAIFKKPGGDYLVGVRADFEMGSEAYFVDHNNGKWTDAGPTLVEGFSKDNYYVFPRKGTTVEVFEKLPEDTEPAPDSPKGKKLYDLEWKSGRFTKKK
ncbi:MAG: hypothetical protein IT173_10850 [Acidobacteria bacterium]|nr:hypothetical protein [Acidobacteriota bacterium]